MHDRGMKYLICCLVAREEACRGGGKSIGTVEERLLLHTLQGLLGHLQGLAGLQVVLGSLQVAGSLARLLQGVSSFLGLGCRTGSCQNRDSRWSCSWSL